MSVEQIKQDALNLIQNAVSKKADLIRIIINTKVTTILFYYKEAKTCETYITADYDGGMNVSAFIYQVLSDISDTSFAPKMQQTAKIKSKKTLPDAVDSIDIHTFPMEFSFEMLLILNYPAEKSTDRETKATDLAIDAIKQLEKPLYIFNSILDVDKPETLHNLDTLKKILMMAYDEGFAAGAQLGNSQHLKL